MNDKIKGYGLTIIAALSWGFSGVCGEYLMGHLGVDARYITVTRMIFAGIILLGYIWKKEGFSMRQQSLLTNKKEVITLVCFVILGLVLMQYSYLVAIQFSNAGTATMLQYLGPILIIMYMCIIQKRLPHYLELGAVMFSFVGSVLLATGGRLNNIIISKEALIWGLLSAVGVLLYTIIPMELIKKYTSTIIFGYGFIIGGAITAGLFKVHTIAVTYSVPMVLALFGMIIVGTVLAFTWYLQGVTLIGPVNASMVACLEPISAVLFSAILFQTHFSSVDVLGMTFIVGGVLLITLKDYMQARVEPVESAVLVKSE